MILARGKVRVEVMPDNWTLDGDGLAQFVRNRLPTALRTMLGHDARLPRNVFTDRGAGMYNPAGNIDAKYHDAIQATGFHVYWGADAKQQSPDMGDLLLHETAVAWFRRLMQKERPVVAPWEETVQQWTARAQRVVRYINKEYNVLGLCRKFPDRLQSCKDSGGERLRK